VLVGAPPDDEQVTTLSGLEDNVETMVELGEHYAPTTDEYDAGVYRVVGAPDDVTLLRVADADGRRVPTGEISHVSGETLDAAFEPAADPDAGFSPVSVVRNALSRMYWSVRRLF
jgi:hypothetical protein